ncbi:hypothetical protein GCM10011316_28590 [Roseibium aquae]|uniref:Uncharacterized protein n=1 Tax=Roseibium aquae TaxID=1323746 RepID=A0A916TNU8_9HYPH|nr:hypothetical protein GCM10011316_28590 [Roseibium aquae]
MRPRSSVAFEVAKTVAPFDTGLLFSSRTRPNRCLVGLAVHAGKRFAARDAKRLPWAIDLAGLS